MDAPCKTAERVSSVATVNASVGCSEAEKFKFNVLETMASFQDACARLSRARALSRDQACVGSQ